MTLDKLYPISLARFMPLYFDTQRTFKDVMIEFDSNENVTDEFGGVNEVNVSRPSAEYRTILFTATYRPHIFII